jgi:hypothetical protein
MSTYSDDAPKRAKRQPTGDYESGYCRPPKGGQFKKGEPSRNPKGRPRRSKGADAIIEETSRALLSFSHNGKVIKVTRFEAMILKLYAEAFKGDRKAQTELLRLRLNYARKRLSNSDDDDVVEPFTLILHGQKVEDKPKPVQQRKPRLSMRSRKNEARRETINRVAGLMVTVNDSGVRKRMTFERALWNLIWASALAGDKAAIRLIGRYMDAISECASQDPQPDLNDDGVEVFTLNLGTLIDDNRKAEGEEDDPESMAQVVQTRRAPVRSSQSRAGISGMSASSRMRHPGL